MSARSTVLKKSQVQLSGEPVVTGEGASGRLVPPRDAGRRANAPIVNVRRNGDVIEAIEVSCPCGQTTVIECLYDARQTEITP